MARPRPSPASRAPLLPLLAALLLDVAGANRGKDFDIHWNTSNSIFRIDNTDHVFDLNKGNSQFEYDQVNIMCPTYGPDSRQENQETFMVYNVSKEEYDTCRITNPNPRVIAICDKPQKLLFFTITFRPFSPQPGGLEFFPGRDYYFISTSSRDDMHRRIGGWCSSHNMKLVFRVCCRPEEPTSTAPPPPPPPRPPPPSPAAPPPRPQPPPAPSRPTTTRRPPNNKKTHKYDKAANEVATKEGLSSASRRRPSTTTTLLTLPTMLLATLVASLRR